MMKKKSMIRNPIFYNYQTTFYCRSSAKSQLKRSSSANVRARIGVVASQIFSLPKTYFDELILAFWSKGTPQYSAQGDGRLSTPTSWSTSSTALPNHVALKLCKDPIFRTRDIHIVSSYNGLLLCEDRWMGSVSLYISNPIGESLAIPKPSKYKKIRFTNCYSGFGFSPISDVYKVVLIKKPTDWSKEPGARVLTVGSTTWRSIEGFDEILALSYGTYHDGFIRWLGRRMGSLGIFAFDVETERFQQIPLPPCRFDMKNVPNYNLGVLKGCLSVTVYSLHSIFVWVMKEFGVKESWTQELNICSNPCLCPSDYPQLVNLTEEGKILLLENCGILRAYSPGTRDLASVET